MPRNKKYTSTNNEDSDSDDEITSSQTRFVLTIPSIIYNTVANENTWTIALIALFIVTAVGVLGIFLDDDEMQPDSLSNYYYESYDGSNKIIHLPTELFPLMDISRDEIFYEEEEMEEGPGKEVNVDDSTIAFFVDIPNSGGSTFIKYTVPCFDLLGASDIVTDNKGLEVINVNNGNYVNVNTFTINGLLHAKKLHLIDNMDIDILATPLLYETLNILFCRLISSEENDGDMPLRRIRMITLLRDPIERIITSYKQNNNSTSLLEYLKTTDSIQSNYITKLLVNKQKITKDDLILAKQILFQKCIIGLYNEKSDSISRWKKLFGWKFVDTCSSNNFINWEFKEDDVEMDLPGEDSEEYKLLIEMNEFDIELYEYAKGLFIEQGSLFV